jgi:hypothetical protein
MRGVGQLFFELESVLKALFVNFLLSVRLRHIWQDCCSFIQPRLHCIQQQVFTLLLVEHQEERALSLQHFGVIFFKLDFLL